MPTQYLPSDDHIARFVKRSLLMWNDDFTEVIGVFPQAFELRDGERDLSVSWLEYFKGDPTDQLRSVRMHTDLTVKARDGFGVLSVASFQDACGSQGGRTRIIHEPTEKNPAHAAVHQYPRNEPELMAILANIAGRRLALVRDIDR